MWLDRKQLSDGSDAMVLALGRAVVLAQHFEHTCKEVLMWIELGKAFEQKRFESLEGSASFVDELLGLFLGLAVRQLGEHSEVKSEDVALLEAGKNARNYIVHEAAIVLLAKSSGDDLKSQLARFDSEVRSLADADGLVSGWSYEICEKEPQPWTQRQIYPGMVVDWIEEPLREAG